MTITTNRGCQDALRPLGYNGRVRLLPGAIAERVPDAASTYMELGVDAPLKGFRERAGLPAPGAGLDGWATRTSAATFGQWVSGIARLGAVLDDASLRERAIDLVEGWAATLPPDGDPQMGTYGWEKLACGLVDVSEHTGHTDALDHLLRITEAAARTFDRSRPMATPTDRDGRRPAGALEWYTLAENVYRGYLATGDGRLKDFAGLWHYDAYWDAFAEAPADGTSWDVPAWLHAYSHVNTFASVAALYEVSGDQRHLDIVRNAHDWATSTQIYATGGFGPGEWSVPADGSLGRALEMRTDSAEITCGSWAAFKLCSFLLRTTGEARFAEWAEQLVYSGIGATIPVRVDGRTPYYADFRLGVSTKLPHWDHWPCCSGTYVQAVAHLADLVWFGTEDGVSAAMFVPSQVRVDHAGREVTVTQRTDFPRGDEARFQVDGGTPVRFALRVRVPSWSRGMVFRIDGEPAEVPVDGHGWAVVDREWSPGDVLTVRVGAGLRAMPVDAWHPHRVAFAHGPVVLAQETVFASPLAAGPLEVLDVDALLLRDEVPLHYRPAWRGAAEQRTGGFRPLSDVEERWPHRVYHDLDDARVI